MPSFRKLSEPEIAALDQPSPSARALAVQQYDTYLASFAAGDYGLAELAADERRAAVRQRLRAAARRRDLALRFLPGPGSLTFRVEAAPAPVSSPTPPQEPVRVALVAAQRDDSARRDPTPPRPPRPPRRRPTAAERYHEVLPRWMRAGQPPGRQGDSKRRQGR